MKTSKLYHMTLLLGSTILMGSAAFAEETLPTSKVSAKVSDIDKVSAATSQRVGENEGSQKITQEYIKAQQATTLADALRKTNSVQVTEEGGQQGTLIFIRGFTQDEVSIRIEGAPKNFNQVRHGGAGTVWLEPTMFKSINIIPGIASNVYGSGSLGGVMLLETKDPEDIISKDRDWGFGISPGFETNATSYNVSVEGAKKFNDIFAVSGTFVVRDTKQYTDATGAKALLGSTGTKDLNFLVKAVVTPSDDKRIEVSYLGLRKEYTARTTVGSGAYGKPSETEVDDDTITAQFTWNPEDNQYVDLNTRLSQAKTKRWRLQEGAAAPSIWKVKTTYAEIENVSRFFQSEEITHQVRYGLDYTFDDVQTAYSNTDSSPMTAKRTQIGVYLSDNIVIGETLEITGSMRFDHFKNDYLDAKVISEKAFSPKLAVNWKPFENTAAKGLQIFGTLGNGFRAPSTHEARANEIPSCGSRSCSIREANDSLKGQTSFSWEVGVGYQKSGFITDNDQLELKLTYIRNTAKNYITSVVLDQYVGDLEGDDEGKTIYVYQYQNVDKATIKGVEVSLNYTNDKWFTAVTAQSMKGVYASGASEGLKLPEISPASINFTVGGYLFDGKSRVGIDLSHRSSRTFIQRRVERLKQEYTIFDLFGSYQVNENLLIQVRAENLFNSLYTKRKIVTIEGEDTTTYAAGRNIKINATYKF